MAYSVYCVHMSVFGTAATSQPGKVKIYPTDPIPMPAVMDADQATWQRLDDDDDDDDDLMIKMMKQHIYLKLFICSKTKKNWQLFEHDAATQSLINLRTSPLSSFFFPLCLQPFLKL